MTDSRFSAYPSEQEYLLMEGFVVYVLDVEDGFVIKNNNPGVKNYNGRNITLIYLQDW